MSGELRAESWRGSGDPSHLHTIHSSPTITYQSPSQNICKTNGDYSLFSLLFSTVLFCSLLFFRSHVLEREERRERGKGERREERTK